MNRKGSTAIIVTIILIIIAMAAGLGIGFMFGKTYSDKQIKETDAYVERPLESVSIDDAESAISENIETTDDTEVLGTDDSVTVLKVNGQAVSMNEVNVRLYTLRSYYVEIYGEEPWAEITDTGMTVAEAAKAQLESDIIRAEICTAKAADYGVVVTDEIKAMNRSEAQSFLDSIGGDISSQFGLTLTALQNVYIKYSVITEVTNILDDQIREELMQDEANQGLSDAELEVKISEESQKIMNSWMAETQVEYEDVWEQIVVGSVG